MLDEPFTALDNYLKMQLERELMNVMEDYGKTVLFVSHDRNEAYRMTDRIAVMEDGQILDVQPKEELFQNPASLAATLLTGCKMSRCCRLNLIADMRQRTGESACLRRPRKAATNMRHSGHTIFRSFRQWRQRMCWSVTSCG